MTTVALLALGLVLLESVADVLPDGPIVWIVTPTRLVVAVGLVALLASVRRLDRSTLAWRLPFDVGTALLLLAAAVPAARYDGWAQWRGLLTCVAVAWLAAGVLRRTTEAWPAITLVAFGSVATAALVGVRQTVAGVPTGFCRGALDGSADSCGHPGVVSRAIGTFGNPNLLAAFLVLLLPLAVAAVVALGHRQARAMGFLVVAVGVAGVVATGSRAGVLALVVSGGAFLVLRRPTTPRLLLGAGVAGAGLAAGAVLVALGRGVGVRADVWRGALRVAADHPWGVGVGRSGAFVDAAVPGDERFQHAHNLFLDSLLEAGPFGLLGTLVLVVVAATCVIRAARRGSAAGIALGSSLAGFAVLCLVDDPTNAIRNAYAAWAVLGLAVSAGNAVRHRRDLDALSRPGAPAVPLRGARAARPRVRAGA